MCLLLRKTLSRGRSGEPKSPLRTPYWRRNKRLAFSLFLSVIFHRPHAIIRASLALLGACAGERLARLDLDYFAFITDALALVGLGLAHLADLGGELAHRLLVGAAYMHLVHPFKLHRDVAGNRYRHRI